MLVIGINKGEVYDKLDDPYTGQKELKVMYLEDEKEEE